MVNGGNFKVVGLFEKRVVIAKFRLGWECEEAAGGGSLCLGSANSPPMFA